MARFFLIICLFTSSYIYAEPAPLSADVLKFVAVRAPVIAITHVRVIDGTGGPARADQTIVISGTTIREIGASSAVNPPAGALVLDKHDETAIPGLVGMHDHLFYAQFERAFARAGGLLLAGVDPTGDGGVLPGFGDQREVELLVEAGFG